MIIRTRSAPYRPFRHRKDYSARMTSSTTAGFATRLPTRTSLASGLTIPIMIYGTAWKKSETDRLVGQALDCGFTAIDTAAQPRHYQEHLVGKGIRQVLDDGKLARDQLYVRLASCL